MKPETRRAALRAAAKAALVLSVGCSSAAPTAAPSNSTPSAAPSCAEYLGGLATAKPEELAADDPLRDQPEVYAAFADPEARQSPRTQECCAEALAAVGENVAQRWECCSALPSPSPAACTPWGPPCPPTMV